MSSGTIKVLCSPSLRLEQFLKAERKHIGIQHPWYYSVISADLALKISELLHELELTYRIDITLNIDLICYLVVVFLFCDFTILNPH